MLRAAIIVIVLMGLAATVLGHLPHASPAKPRVIMAAAASATAPAAPGPASGQTLNALDHAIELTRDSSGYFYADVRINGAPVHMLVDTGATVIALSRDDARMAGIATSIGMNDVVGQGADGVVKGEQVTIDSVTLGDRTVERLPAIVLGSGGQSLLGQSFLSQFASVKIEGDKMELR